LPLSAVRPSGASFSWSVPSLSLASTSILAAVVAAGGCATGQLLDVKKVDAAVQPPANVALYLKIAREDGQSVTLRPNDFKVYEDGKQLPAKKVKRALLPVKYAVDRYVLVVVDLSGPLVDSEYLSTLQDALSSLAERIGKDAHVGLSGFDGDGMVPFIALDDSDTAAGLSAMRKFRPRSRNIDLWGTFIGALDVLDEAANQSSVPYQQSTLILVTDRVDKAGRHSREEALARVQKSRADVYVVGIGDGIRREELEPLGKTGALFAAEARELEKPFVELSDRIESQLGHDYLFSYCSPPKSGKRAASRTVEVRIATSQWRASVEHQFSTRGFTKAACDPEAVPDFKTKAEKQAENEVDFHQGFTTGEGSDDEGTSKKKTRKKKPIPENEEDQGG
jgi:hypothetical protein